MLTKDEMDFVLGLLDRRPIFPMTCKDSHESENVVDKFLNLYLAKAMIIPTDKPV